MSQDTPVGGLQIQATLPSGTSTTEAKNELKLLRPNTDCMVIYIPAIGLEIKVSSGAPAEARWCSITRLSLQVDPRQLRVDVEKSARSANVGIRAGEPKISGAGDLRIPADMNLRELGALVVGKRFWRASNLQRKKPQSFMHCR